MYKKETLFGVPLVIIIVRFKRLIAYLVGIACFLFLFNIFVHFGGTPLPTQAVLNPLNSPNVSAAASLSPSNAASPLPSPEAKKYIKWAEFKVPQVVLEKAMNLDIKTHSTSSQVQINWIELLACLTSKYYGNMKSYKPKDMDLIAEALKKGTTMGELTKNMKLYSYYLEAYTAILSGLCGEYMAQIPDKKDKNIKIWTKVYGLKAFSPFGAGYYYSQFDDFGTERSFGYKRKHLGHDMMGSVGAPIIAIESGTIEAIGWNQYGGWRLGIRTFDKKRSYYYAHLRKTHPYYSSLKLGSIVKAGDVIGYLGMTGYSSKEGSNNVKKPHLHVGMQLVFNEVQKEGINQIWIDIYDIINLLQKRRSFVKMDPVTKDFNRIYDFMDPEMPE